MSITTMTMGERESGWWGEWFVTWTVSLVKKLKNQRCLYHHEMSDEGKWGKQREEGGLKLKFEKTGEEASWKRKKHMLWGQTCLPILESYLSFPNISISLMKVTTIYVSGKSSVPAHVIFFACNVKRDFLKAKQNKNKTNFEMFKKHLRKLRKTSSFHPRHWLACNEGGTWHTLSHLNQRQYLSHGLLVHLPAVNEARLSGERKNDTLYHNVHNTYENWIAITYLIWHFLTFEGRILQPELYSFPVSHLVSNKYAGEYFNWYSWHFRFERKGGGEISSKALIFWSQMSKIKPVNVNGDSDSPAFGA